MKESLAGTIVDIADRAKSWPAGLVNRGIGAALFVPTATVIGIAAFLTPSPTGYGTHTKLGLGECTMLHFTGFPCPMCGMTTTFALMAHLRPVDALLNQPFGPFLFAATVAAAVVGGIDLLTGAGVWKRVLLALERFEQRIAIFMLVGLFAGWIYKILLMHPELRPWAA